MLGETAGETAHDFISSNLIQLPQRVREVVCAYHCCQPEEGSLVMACDKQNIFSTVSVLVYHQNVPYHCREQSISTTAMIKYFRIQCNSSFQTFFHSLLVWSTLKVFTKRKNAFPGIL